MTPPLVLGVCAALAGAGLLLLLLLRSPRTRLSRWLEAIDPGQDTPGGTA